MEPITMGSLFDGIGGFPLAAVRNGIEPLWASEIEAFPIEVTKAHFPNMIHVGDITKLDGAKLPPVDIICGGSPCQDLSVAGARAGLAGERSGLFMEQIRVIREMRDADRERGRTGNAVRPRFGCWENVPGAFSSASGDDFQAVIEEFLHIEEPQLHVVRPPSGRWEYTGAVLGNQSCVAWTTWDELAADPALELDYIVATPRMSYYIEYSTRIYNIYLKYAAPEDIHVYSIDEVFIDATEYLKTRSMSAHDFAMLMIQDVLQSTGITATAGIGPNLYLCKVAMDIWAKHIPADKDGVRIAELDERTYRQYLWAHTPITDFWRVGKGYAKKLAANGMYTMGDVARCSVGKPNEERNEELLYQLFGVNAELLIDHAWGWEPCEIRHIKAYKPESNSISNGQVLQEPYSTEKAKIIVREMTESLVMELVAKGLVTDQVMLTVGYDIESVTPDYKGELTTDWYGRKIPKQAHSSENLGRQTSSTRLIVDAMMRLYDRIVNPRLLVRRMYVVANHIVPAGEVKDEPAFEQLDLFTDFEEVQKEQEKEKAALEKEKRLQQAMLSIKQRYGKNSILHGTSYQEGATGRERNRQIGGHKE